MCSTLKISQNLKSLKKKVILVEFALPCLALRANIVGHTGYTFLMMDVISSGVGNGLTRTGWRKIGKKDRSRKSDLRNMNIQFLEWIWKLNVTHSIAYCTLCRKEFNCAN